MIKSAYKKETVFPVKIVASDKCADTEKLLMKKQLQIVMPCLNVAKLDPCGWVILDFGKEVYGSLRILLGERSASCETLRITLGESVAETFVQSEDTPSCNDHSVRDGEYMCSSYSDIGTPKTGFRFARIQNGAAHTEIFAVAAESEIFSVERKGFFHCNDEEIDKIAETALYTATLCVQNGVIWDGIKRDRLVWMGDMHPEILTLSQAYGVIEEMKNSLDFIDFYAPDSWINLHPAYSAWWIICFAEYYMISADKAYVGKNLRRVNEIVSDFRTIIKSDGSVDIKRSNLAYYEGCEFFFDWPTALKKESEIGWASLIKIAMETAADLLESFGENGFVAKAVASDVAKNPVIDTDYKEIEAFNFLAARKGPEIKDVLLDGGGKGMTSFMAYYILTAAAACGGGERVLRMIKEFYGGMLSLGATTFWEDFSTDWLKDNPQGITDLPTEVKNIHRDYGKFCYKGVRHSLCHGWASGVYAFLTRTVLGIRPIEAGYKKISVKPNLIGLKAVEGTVPTPYGNIYVKHEMKKDGLASTVKVPKEICVVNNDKKLRLDVSSERSFYVTEWM